MRKSLFIQIDGETCTASSGEGTEYPCRAEYGDFGESFAILTPPVLFLSQCQSMESAEIFILFLTRRGGRPGSGETRRRSEELQPQDNPLL